MVLEYLHHQVHNNLLQVLFLRLKNKKQLSIDKTNVSYLLGLYIHSKRFYTVVKGNVCMTKCINTK